MMLGCVKPGYQKFWVEAAQLPPQNLERRLPLANIALPNPNKVFDLYSRHISTALVKEQLYRVFRFDVRGPELWNPMVPERVCQRAVDLAKSFSFFSSCFPFLFELCSPSSDPVVFARAVSLLALCRAVSQEYK